VLSLHSNATLAEAGLLTGDTVTPGHKDGAQEGISTLVSGDRSDSNMDVCNTGTSDEKLAFYRVAISSGCFPHNPFEAVILSAHYFLLSSTDLVCLTETPNSVPGFAPSVRGRLLVYFIFVLR
jgi:hypothetical protein